MIFGAALLIFAACSQDEMPGDGNTLPEGKYPLEIASVTMDVTHSEQPWSTDVPQTRVMENSDGNSSTWEWDGTEKISVQLNADVATYTLNADKTLTADKALYWKSSSKATVNAWYPTDAEVSLADQSKKLAYVLKGSGEGDYNTPVMLSFTHALAKMRVIPSGNDADKVTDVKIKSLTSCTNTQGVVDGSDATEGWITMQHVEDEGYWEANMVPGHEITQFQVNGVEGTLTTPVTPTAAKVNTITLTVGEKGINISDITGTEYTVSGNVYLIGDDKEHSLKLKLTEGANLTLKNVKLKPNEGGNVVTCNGDATINLKGDNSIISGSTNNDAFGAGIIITKGTLTINGDSNAKLNVRGIGLFEGACIGASNNANIIINGGNIDAVSISIPSYGGQAAIGSAGSYRICGNIIINGGTIKATGGQDSTGIGASSAGACGNIEINGGNVSAYGGEGFTGGIGSAWNGSCGTITIKGTGTTVYAKKGYEATVSIGKGSDSCADCGTVTIGKECKVTQE